MHIHCILYIDHTESLALVLARPCQYLSDISLDMRAESCKCKFEISASPGSPECLVSIVRTDSVPVSVMGRAGGILALYCCLVCCYGIDLDSQYSEVQPIRAEYL